MGPKQPWRRVKKLEGMEETDGQEMSLPDLPKGLRGKSSAEDSSRDEGSPSLSRAPGVW